MTTPLLSILIATLPERRKSFERLCRLLRAQIDAVDGKAEIRADTRTQVSTGEKRNSLLCDAKGDYVCFFDDDDLPSDDYVAKLLTACAQGADCCSISGWAVFDKRPRKLFVNSMVESDWGEDSDMFYRTPNHLNPVRRELALRVGFPDRTIGEDYHYSQNLRPLLKTETEIPGVVYYYFSEPEVRARAAGMRLLLKWPTRERPELFAETFKRIHDSISADAREHRTAMVVTLDEDDPTLPQYRSLLERRPAVSLVVGPAHRGKVAAINADIPRDDWDVLVLLADDMLPVEQNWDERIVLDMARNFPDLDGVLAYDDGFQKAPVEPDEVSCITMPVMGRKFYERQGYVYHPEYTSIWCDMELADVARAAGKAKRVPRVIIKHDWIGQAPDALLFHNESFYEADKAVYGRRKAAGFPHGSSLVYSQNDEETTILRELGAMDSGRFLDIGAHDGRTFSNTLRLIEKGWGGVMVEPSPVPFAGLLKNHGGNPRLMLVNAAVASKPGWATFRDSSGDMISTLSESHAEKWSAAGVRWTPYMLKTVSPRELFAQVGFDFQFVNLDVEGVNIDVFRAIPWATLVREGGLRLVCIEHDGNQDEIRRGLEPLDFAVIAENPENLILRRPA